MMHPDILSWREGSENQTFTVGLWKSLDEEMDSPSECSLASHLGQLLFSNALLALRAQREVWSLL